MKISELIDVLSELDPESEILSCREDMLYEPLVIDSSDNCDGSQYIVGFGDFVGGA